MSGLDRVLARARATAETRMRETVRLFTHEPDGFDRAAGRTVPGARTVLYEGRARVKRVMQAAGDHVSAAERRVSLRDYEVHLPWSTPLPPDVLVMPGFQVEVLESQDARMVGLILWVIGVAYSDQASAWRLSTEDRS
ncbi:DUF6093 family protein [Streptomyces sp. NPDC042207]|uniref:DUF6093 family protein n=1 Tax=Streptomyces sp. NPDC042207 TaxID=3154331 RepID=UPI0033C630DF